MRRAAVRDAVHGSIVAVICACLSMGLCYAMPQHHRMDHKLLMVCLCCFAHHHVCSTFATLDEKWTRGFALDALPRPVHRIMAGATPLPNRGSLHSERNHKGWHAKTFCLRLGHTACDSAGDR